MTCISWLQELTKVSAKVFLFDLYQFRFIANYRCLDPIFGFFNFGVFSDSSSLYQLVVIDVSLLPTSLLCISLL